MAKIRIWEAAQSSRSTQDYDYPLLKKALGKNWQELPVEDAIEKLKHFCDDHKKCPSGDLRERAIKAATNLALLVVPQKGN